MVLFSPGMDGKYLFFLRFVQFFPPFVQYSLQLTPRMLYNVGNIMRKGFFSERDSLEFIEFPGFPLQIPNLRTTERYRAGGAARSESKS